MPEPELYARACRHGWSFACEQAVGVAMRRARSLRRAGRDLAARCCASSACRAQPRHRPRCRPIADFVEFRPARSRWAPIRPRSAGVRQRAMVAGRRRRHSRPAGVLHRPPRGDGREFAAFAARARWTVDQRALAGRRHIPVTFVSWPDALAYCRWLEATLKASPTTPPRSQALLAKAGASRCRRRRVGEGGARHRSPRAIPWGNQPRQDRANFEGTGTTPVGSSRVPSARTGCPT